MVQSNVARREEPHDPAPVPSSNDVANLVKANVPYAFAIAAEVSRRLPPDVERKEIEGWAELGLVEAAHSFDPSRGVQFKTFAYYRIKGAIYDGMRKMGWYPKGLYQQMRFEMAANEYLKDASSEAPQAGTPESQLNHLHDLTGNLLSCYMLSLEAGRMDPADQGQVSAEDTVVLTEQRKHLRLSLMQLPETNRRVVECYYFEQLTFDQIGERLGLSKSWVCRVHAKSLEMLRKLLAPARTSPVANPSATFSEVIR